MHTPTPSGHADAGEQAFLPAFPSAEPWLCHDGGKQRLPSRNPGVPRPLSPLVGWPAMIRPFLRSLPAGEEGLGSRFYVHFRLQQSTAFNGKSLMPLLAV